MATHHNVDRPIINIDRPIINMAENLKDFHENNIFNICILYLVESIKLIPKTADQNMNWSKFLIFGIFVTFRLTVYILVNHTEKTNLREKLKKMLCFFIYQQFFERLGTSFSGCVFFSGWISYLQ